MENYNILKSKLNLLRGKYFNFEIIQNNREKENKREKMRYIYKYIYYIYIEREINESDLKKKSISGRFEPSKRERMMLEE